MKQKYMKNKRIGLAMTALILVTVFTPLASADLVDDMFDLGGNTDWIQSLLDKLASPIGSLIGFVLLIVIIGILLQHFGKFPKTVEDFVEQIWGIVSEILLSIGWVAAIIFIAILFLGLFSLLLFVI